MPRAVIGQSSHSHREAIVGCEIVRCPWRAVLLEIARRAADDHAARGELARDKTRVRKLSHPHGDIDTFVDQVGEADTQHQFDGEGGKTRGEIRNGGRQLKYAEARRGIDAQVPARGRVHVSAIRQGRSTNVN